MFTVVAAAVMVAVVIVILVAPRLMKRYAQEAALTSKRNQLAQLIAEAEQALRTAGQGDWSRHAAIWLKAARREYDSARLLSCAGKQAFQTLLSLTAEQTMLALDSGIWAARQSLAWSKPEQPVGEFLVG